MRQEDKINQYTCITEKSTTMCIKKFKRLKLNFTPEIKISLLLCAPGKSESESGHQIPFSKSQKWQMSFLVRSSCDLGWVSVILRPQSRPCLSRILVGETAGARVARNRGRRATIRLSLSRATNKTTTSMRAPGLSLLAAVISVSFSDALSTLNGRVDEDHNAIVVEGGSTRASLLPIHDIEVSLCSRTCVSDKPQIGLLLSDLAAKIGSPIGESAWQSRIWKRIVF